MKHPVYKVYKNVTMQVKLHDTTNHIKIEQVVRQGDSMSPKLFITALKYLRLAKAQLRTRVIYR